MSRLLLTSGIAAWHLRKCRIVLPTVLMLGTTAATAQLGGTLGQPLNNPQKGPQDSLAGQWRGVYQGITITIVIEPTGQYIETAQSAAAMTQESGPYKLVAPNTIIFSVTNWEPKTMPVYHPTGTVGGYYTQEPMAKPPGATDTYVFKGANTVVLTDQVMHGSITMNRVP